MRSLLLATLSLWLVFPVWADSRQHGNMIYDLPEGWRIGKLEHGVRVLLPRSSYDRCDTCRIYLAMGGAKTSSPDAFLQSRLPMIFDEKQMSRLQMVDTRTPPSDYGGHKVDVRTWRIGRRVYLGAIVNLPDRYELAVFGLRWEQQSDGLKINRHFVPMLGDMAYLSEGAPSLLPAAEPGRISGMFRGYKMSIAVGAGGTGTLAPSYRTLFFWKDGHFFSGTPPTGTEPLDRDALLADGRANFGVYKQSRQKVVLTYADGQTQEMVPLTGKDRGWHINGRDLYPAKPLADGTVLNGSISKMSFGSFSSGSGISGGTAAASSVHFFPDGTYKTGTTVGSSGGFQSGVGWPGTHPPKDMAFTGFGMGWWNLKHYWGQSPYRVWLSSNSTRHLSEAMSLSRPSKA